MDGDSRAGDARLAKVNLGMHGDAIGHSHTLSLARSGGVKKRPCPHSHRAWAWLVDNLDRASWQLALRLIEEAYELLAAAGLLELADGFGFDLANAFAGDLED